MFETLQCIIMIILQLLIVIDVFLLNQARAGRRPARAWFLKVEPVRIVSMCVYVCVCVCVRPRGY